MRAGDQVELRSAGEILATLDDDGCLDGVPFMPEMLAYLGRQFTVSAQVERACDTIDYSGVLRLKDTVILDDERCDGSGHDGCQAQCRLYWKEAWLRPASAGDTTGQGSSAVDALAELGRRARASVDPEHSTADERTYRCQATELVRAGERVSWYDLHSLFGELRGGNVGPLRWLYVMVRVVLHELGLRVGLATTDFSPFRPDELGEAPAATEPPRGLGVGQLVQIRPRDEIRTTLGPTGKNRGMSFDKEMVPYCGRTARVKAKVERFIDERTGRMVELASDAYILDGVVCQSYRSDKRWFCARAIYPWWREVWLEPLPTADADVGRDVAPGV
jgi:hypothetical protein